MLITTAAAPGLTSPLNKGRLGPVQVKEGRRGRTNGRAGGEATVYPLLVLRQLNGSEDEAGLNRYVLVYFFGWCGADTLYGAS